MSIMPPIHVCVVYRTTLPFVFHNKMWTPEAFKCHLYVYNPIFLLNFVSVAYIKVYSNNAEFTVNKKKNKKTTTIHIDHLTKC